MRYGLVKLDHIITGINLIGSTNWLSISVREICFYSCFDVVCNCFAFKFTSLFSKHFLPSDFLKKVIIVQIGFKYFACIIGFTINVGIGNQK